VYCRWLAQRSALVTASCYSEAARGPQLMKLGQAVVDILVATPRRLRYLLQEKFVTLENVIFVLLDNVDELIDQALEATEFVVQALPQKRISCSNSNQDLTATHHPKRIAVMNFLNSSKFLHNEIVIYHEGFSPPPIPNFPRWTTVDEHYD
jgi:superfamily II DNA/RNA helicase